MKNFKLFLIAATLVSLVAIGIGTANANSNTATEGASITCGQERKGQNGAMLEERLNDAIKDGKLTEAQKTAILAKRTEMQKDCAEHQNLSAEEKAKVRSEHRAEMKKWAEDNGIDPELFPQRGPRSGQGNGGNCPNK